MHSKSRKTGRKIKQVKKRSISRSRSLASPTRGWRKMSPKKTSSRRAMLSRCGSKCFLVPSKLKYPICDTSCKINCKGVTAAYVRSRQWKQKTVSARSRSLINQLGCTKKSRSMSKSKPMNRRR